MTSTWAGRAAAVAATLAVLTLQTAPANALLYDGTSPVATGCNTSAITARQAYITYGGFNIGEVKLRYSTDCRTAWAHVYSFVTACDSNGNGCFTATVTRNSDNLSYNQNSAVGATGSWSKQVNDAGVTSYASSCMYYASGYRCANTTSY